MIIRIVVIFLSSFLINFNAFGEKFDCSKFNKLSTEYIQCNAAKLKEKTKNKVEKSKEKFEKSGIKMKLKKFKNSKTLKDLTKE